MNQKKKKERKTDHDSKSPTRLRTTILFFFGGSSEGWGASLNDCPRTSPNTLSEPSWLAAGVVTGGSLFLGLGNDDDDDGGCCCGGGGAVTELELDDDDDESDDRVENGKPTYEETGVAAGVTWEMVEPDVNNTDDDEWWCPDEVE